MTSGMPDKASKPKVSKELADVLNEAAAEVETWPDWKRSRDPLGEASGEGAPPPMYQDYVCDQPLEVIRTNECDNALLSVSTQRFRRLFNELAAAEAANRELRAALEEIGNEIGKPVPSYYTEREQYACFEEIIATVSKLIQKALTAGTQGELSKEKL